MRRVRRRTCPADHAGMNIVQGEATPVTSPAAVLTCADPAEAVACVDAATWSTSWSTALAAACAPALERIDTLAADPGVIGSRAGYAGWLRRQSAAWWFADLPAVPVATPHWQLSSVRPACLDVLGLLAADLREISPGARPAIPRQPSPAEAVDVTRQVGAVYTCVSVAALLAPLLPAAQSLTAGLTQVGSSTRYLQRCADLAERTAGLQRELDQWAVRAGQDAAA